MDGNNKKKKQVAGFHSRKDTEINKNEILSAIYFFCNEQKIKKLAAAEVE